MQDPQGFREYLQRGACTIVQTDVARIGGITPWLKCAHLAGADPKEFYGALRNFRRVASTAQKWWASDGAKERYEEMLAAQQEPPLFLNLVWSDYGRMAAEIAAAHARGKRVTAHTHGAIGIRNAINAGLDIVAPLYAAKTEFGMKFDEIKKKDGLGAALKWRAAQFKE